MPSALARAAFLSAFLAPLAWLPAAPGVAAQQPAGDPLRVVRLEAEPAAVLVRAGEAIEFRVTAYDEAGNVVDAPVRITAPRSAVRIADGRLRGLRAGEFAAVATLVLPPDAEREPLTLRVPVTVDWPPVARIEIRADAGTLYGGTTIRHRARAFHADGSERPGVEVEWSSSDPAVAEVDAFGHVTAKAAGRVTIAAELEGARADVAYDVRPLPAATLEITGGYDGVRTGDVQTFRAVARDARGREVPDVPVTWSLAYEPPPGEAAPPAPGQIRGGRMVADVPGLYTVVASAGPLTAQRSFRASPRQAMQRLEVLGHGRQDRVRTTDFWVFEGRDGRDYALSGAKVSGGTLYVWDVTDPSNIVKTDSLQVDARSINDVKVSPDARYAVATREGASDRRNGIVILDLAEPAHPKAAAEFVEGLTGGVHNAFPTDTHVFALSDGDKYVILDVTDIYNPRYVSEYDHPDSRVHDVWVHDGIAYSAEWETGVVVVDVGNGKWGGSIEKPKFVTRFPLPSGATHAVFPYHQQATGKFYLFVGDEVMSRRGLANEGIGSESYQRRYDPVTGTGGVPVATTGYIQVVNFTDPENPEMVARYEVAEYGTHNIWVEDDVLYQAYYEGGLRVVDVSGELMGNLYTQGREIAVYRSFDPAGYVANAPMVWSAMPFKGNIFFSDTNSGLWAVRLQPRATPVF